MGIGFAYLGISRVSFFARFGYLFVEGNTSVRRYFLQHQADKIGSCRLAISVSLRHACHNPDPEIKSAHLFLTKWLHPSKTGNSTSTMLDFGPYHHPRPSHYQSVQRRTAKTKARKL